MARLAVAVAPYSHMGHGTCEDQMAEATVFGRQLAEQLPEVRLPILGLVVAA